MVSPSRYSSKRQDILSKGRIINGQLVGSLGAYLLQTPEHAIVVDNGFGPRSFESERFNAYGGELLSNLERAGLKPADIDTVFFTHMHSDHVGWIGREVNGKQVYTFPNARYLVRSAEWHRFDNQPALRASVADALNLLEQHIELACQCFFDEKIRRTI